jgi:hypothetical protein
MTTEVTQRTTSVYPKTASILALVGGILMILGGALFLFVSVVILPNLNYGNLHVPPHLTAAAIPAIVSGAVGVMGLFGLVSGAIVLLSAVMLLANVGERKTWGVLILVFSILSFLGLGGFIAGAVLGIVGGILALRWRPPVQQGH